MSARSRRITSVLLSRSVRAVWHSRFGLVSATRRRATFARQLRLGFEELGPAFVKIGQFISVRPDVFSPEMVFEMEGLQDSLAAIPAEQIRAVIETEFGRPVDRLFATFDDDPTASASIAQVHRATIAEDYRPVIGSTLPAGTAVAVKVVRPGTASVIAGDLAVARVWVGRASRFGRLRRYNVQGLLGEFERSLRSELDMRNEAAVADRFAFDFRDDPVAIIPSVVWPRTSRRVLTTEFIEGWRLSELDAAAGAGVDGRALALHGAELFMRQVLVHGRYHADLHPANLFVTPEGRICYLDFGIVGHTQPGERIAIAQVLAATVYGDADRALRYSAELGLVVSEQDQPLVRAEVGALMRETMGAGGKPADVRAFATGFLRILRRHDIEIPLGYGMLIKALATVEGVAKALYPDIDITRAARPFATRLIAQEMFRPERLTARGPDAVRAALLALSE